MRPIVHNGKQMIYKPIITHATDLQIGKIHSRLSKYQAIKKNIYSKYGVSSLKDLTIAEADDVIEDLDSCALYLFTKGGDN